MKRLTNETLKNAIDAYETTIEAYSGYENDESLEEYCFALDRVTVSFLKELQEYRKLEEQGLLLRLPVTLESFVYTAEQDTTGEYEVFDWMVTAIGKDTLFLESDFSDIEVALTEIGKTVFLTKAEAEKALAEMEK